jgi:thioredoxin-related protein
MFLSAGWETDFESARAKAAREHKYLLLNFSGSDWCIPCIRMHKEVFGSEVFRQLADSSLVLYNADFPRLKKNQLSKERQKQNESLADRYNPRGDFPLTLLLDTDGNVIRRWDGYAEAGAEGFLQQLNTLVHGRH